METLNIRTEEEIINKIKAGEKILFEILIRRYNPVLYKIARAYNYNHHDAEDLMQEAHIAAYLNLKNFEQRSSYKTWLCRIMVNKCIYRSSYGYFKNEIPNSEIVNTEPMKSSNYNATERSIGNRELAKVLEQSVQQLPEIYRTVFILREIEGFSVLETAELLNITETNVKVRINRAKTLLQKQLENFYSSSDLYEFNLKYCDSIVNNVFLRIGGNDGATSD